MPRERFTNEQNAFALRRAMYGATVDEVCRTMGVPKIRWFRQLEDANGCSLS